MLEQLSIQNFALIDDIRIEFDEGLNVLTGETGAGKSILLDALRMALGERLEAHMIRDRESSSVICAVFSLDAEFLKKQNALVEFIKEGDEYLILKREILPGGRSKASVNGQLVNLTALKEIGNSLMDFHGQYDQQQILNRDSHRMLLDRLAGLQDQDETVVRYRELFERHQLLNRKRQALLRARDGRERQLDLLQHQIREIEAVSPEPDEEQQLKEERIRLAHAGKLELLAGTLLECLDEKDLSATAQIGIASRELSQLVKIDESAKDLLERMSSVQIEIEELTADLREYREKLNADASSLDTIQQRLDDLERLRRKYGPSLEDVIAFLEKARAEFDGLTNSELYEQENEREQEKILPQLKKDALRMRELRQKAAVALDRSVAGELKDLGIKHARFECRMEETEPGFYGMDRVEFYLSPNAGESLKPLAAIASAGEASRIILGLKRSLMKVDQTPTLVFDEIDANIGGRLGDVVGQKLQEVAAQRQILLITHLPQIASFAHRHIKVHKRVEKGRTTVEYVLLEGEERVRELAQMMSGEKETEISKTHAEELLKSAKR